ncbi:MAG: protein phosphatase 2C domain-containing protein [Ktedonobacteraceae bacterium]|nr:protein phosphatase 2C domain-containing protein [Ktedonobacteraceae bacterium]
MICPFCNMANRDDAKFCKGCGRTLHAEPPPAPVAPAEAQEAAPIAPPPPSPAGSSAAEDLSLAPTLILTPEKMMAFHSRRWQQEIEQEDHAHAGSHAADMPTVLMAPSLDTEQGSVQAQDVAQAPTMGTSGESASIPPPLPGTAPVDAAPVSGEVTRKDPAATAPVQAAGVAADSVQGEDTGMQQQQPAAEQPAPPAQGGQQVQQSSQNTPPAAATTQASGDFPVLAVGTGLSGGRYEVTQVINEDAQEHIYQVIDQQGYQHCWNCGSEQNAEGDEFCIDCGAELLGVAYLMHEYSTSENKEAVLQGNIVNTFVEQGHTYAIEQVQADKNPFPDGVHLLAAALSDAGNIRRDEPNEDSTLTLLIQRIHESQSVPLGVFIVADGMGGHDSGQVASRVVINTVAERMTRELLEVPLASEKDSQQQAKLPDEDDLVNLLHGAIQDANNKICQINQQNKTDMGSTVTGFMVVRNHSYIINVGDSRTYMIRAGQRYQLTTDHSLVGQLVAGGLIQPDEVYTHPQRSQIFRSLGDKPNVQIDLFKQELYPGDIILSCSDGLWEMVRDPQIESILNTAPDPQTACTQLIEAANANGGEDNISAVIVCVR